MHTLYTQPEWRQLITCVTQPQKQFFLFYQEVRQHLEINDTWQKEMSIIEVSKKKVRGGVESRIHEDEDNDEQVSMYSQHINDEEKNKQEDLSLCILWKAQQLKSIYKRLVFFSNWNL